MKPQPKLQPRPPKARKPLQRSRMRRKTYRRLAAMTPQESAYFAWLHTQPCCAKGMRWESGGYTVSHWCHAGVYEGQEPIQASHIRNRSVADGDPYGVTGTARKDVDSSCIPLCRWAHEAFDQAKGPFAGMTRDERKHWHRARNIETLARFAVESGINLLPEVSA